MFEPSELFDLSATEHAALFANCERAWDALKGLKEYIAQSIRPGLFHTAVGPSRIDDDVFIGEGTVVEEGAFIKGPAIIGRNCEIRHGAYIRGNVLVGDDCVVGNSSELKSALLFNGCQVPHFSYVGDSILGRGVHLGAGVKISNLRLISGNVMVEAEGRRVDTGLRKFGALIGDRAEVGCNAVLNPGTIIGRSSLIYPNTFWRGVLPANRIAKNRAPVEVTERSERRAPQT